MVTDIYGDRPIKHIPLTLLSPQPLVPPTIRFITNGRSSNHATYSEELEVDGAVQYSEEESLWVAVVDDIILSNSSLPESDHPKLKKLLPLSRSFFNYRSHKSEINAID